MIFKSRERRKKFFSYYKPYLRIVILDLIFATLSTVITLTIPLLIRYITHNILGSNIPNLINKVFNIGILLIVLLIIKALMFFYTDAKGHGVGAMMESDMREELFTHYQKMSFSFHDKHKTGELVSRIFNDTTELGEFFHHAPEDILLYIVRFIGAFIILWLINVELVLLTVIILPLIGLVAFIGAKRLSRLNKASKQLIGAINGQVEDSISGIRVTQSYTNESREFENFKEGNKEFLNSRVKWYTNEAIIYGILEFMVQIILVIVVVFGSVLIIKAQLEITDLLVFILYIGYLTEPLTRIMWMFSQYQGAYNSFHRFMDILEVEPDIKDSLDAKELLEVRGEITFNNISFSYLNDNKEGNEILKGLNLEIKAGEYLAIIGASGVGKTTLYSLIPRFYDVQVGEILIDGIPIKNIQLNSLRKHIGIVSQDIYLFSGSIYNNILFGNPAASFEEVQNAARKAGILDFIEGLPQGYNTDIGQRGVKLSGGQKQRISIARAFLKDPAILILDEATSSLDYKNEQIVQNSLEELVRNRTTLVIAHRLSTIKSAQRIVVLEDKKIVEEGTHQELLDKEGVYASLYNSSENMI